jgi:hypothetical protein
MQIVFCPFLFAQKGTKKGPAIGYTAMADGSLMKLWYYCSAGQVSPDV